MGTHLYKREDDETLKVTARRTITLVEQVFARDSPEQHVRQTLYQEAWQEVAEILGTGTPCYVQFSQVVRVDEPYGVGLSLTVLIAPLEPVEGVEE